MDTAPLDTGKAAPPKRRLKSLRELDRRTAAAKNAFALQDAIIRDLGGEASLSAMKLALIGNVAILGAALEDLAVSYLAGKDVDMIAFGTLANSQRRLLSDLGLDRRAVEIPQTLSTYLAQRRDPVTQDVEQSDEEHSSP